MKLKGLFYIWLLLKLIVLNTGSQRIQHAETMVKVTPEVESKIEERNSIQERNNNTLFYRQAINLY